MQLHLLRYFKTLAREERFSRAAEACGLIQPARAAAGGSKRRSRPIYMVNQIARNFEALGHDNAIAATADHMVKFWDLRMKAQIAALATKGDDALGPIARVAVIGRGKWGELPPQARAAVANAVDEAGYSDAS